MMAEVDEAIERIAAAIQAEAQDLTEREGALLIGWTLVTEWMDPDGEKWLAENSDADVAPWLIIGYLRSTLAAALRRWADASVSEEDD